MVGQNVGKYRVLDKIGRGGMGTVYRAHDDTLDRDVAIKVLNPELNDPEVVQRFRAEAVTVARLNDPGIATIYELLAARRPVADGHGVRARRNARAPDRQGGRAWRPERAANFCNHGPDRAWPRASAWASSTAISNRRNLMMTEIGHHQNHGLRHCARRPRHRPHHTTPGS